MPQTEPSGTGCVLVCVGLCAWLGERQGGQRGEEQGQTHRQQGGAGGAQERGEGRQQERQETAGGEGVGGNEVPGGLGWGCVYGIWFLVYPPLPPYQAGVCRKNGRPRSAAPPYRSHSHSRLAPTASVSLQIEGDARKKRGGGFCNSESKYYIGPLKRWFQRVSGRGF